MKRLITKLLKIYFLTLCGLFLLNCIGEPASSNHSKVINEFPYKSYELNNSGQIINSDMDEYDFQPSIDCVECHQTHYEEWSNSSHGKSHSNDFFKKCLKDSKDEHGEDSKKFCNQCHNPISIIANISDGLSETQKGVSCDVCHSITRVSSPTIISPTQFVTSELFLNPGEGIKYGAMENPESNSYHESQFNPIFNQSELCLPCHDLRNGELETEITFTEWARIPGMAMSGAFPCQQCHMPEKEDGTHEHYFAGVDLSYNVPPEEDLLYTNVLNLIETAATISFESNSTVLLDSIYRNDIKIPIQIKSENGHHLPSGTSFNRECWLAIEIRAKNEDGIILFQNGILENNTQLLDYYDPELLFFTSFLITEDGDTTQDILKADNILNYSLPGLNTKFTEYNIQIPETVDLIWVQAKLLFRPIKPFLFDELPNLKENIPIYTIDEIEKNIYIIN